MRYLPNTAEAKEADRRTIIEYGMPSMVLMERAALATVEVLEKERIDIRKVLVACGSGNNGGDGFAAARMLHLKGSDVTVWFVGKKESLTEDNRLQMEILENFGVSIVNSFPDKEYSVIIDAVFGIGLSREITGEYLETIKKLNALDGVKVAADIPSGIDAASGKIYGIAFQADITVTYAFEKLGMVLFPGHQYTGRVITKDIGIPVSALPRQTKTAYTLEQPDVRRLLPKRKMNSHKGSYGKVLIAAGSEGMSGAAYLSAKACYQTGAGLVKIYTCSDNRTILQELLPEAIIQTYANIDEGELRDLLSWADVALIGPGLGTSGRAQELLRTFMSVNKKPCVIDADGLNLLSKDMNLLEGKQDIILTPHMMELARLLSTDIEVVKAGRQALLKTFTDRYNAVCVSKDSRTFVMEHDKNLFVNTAGNSALAKAGSGDVLAGIITGLLAQGADSYDAGVLGVYLHALAGDKAKERFGSYSVSAGVLTEQLAEVIKELGEV